MIILAQSSERARLQGALGRRDPFVMDSTCSATPGDGWVDAVLCIRTPRGGDFVWRSRPGLVEETRRCGVRRWFCLGAASLGQRGAV